MIPFVHVETPHDFAHRVQIYAKPHFDRLDMRPYNRFEPETSDWWLTPTIADPAFSSTKFHFAHERDKSGEPTEMLIAGLQAEKGLGESVKEFYPGARGAKWIMTPQWHWFQFAKLIRSGKLLQAIATAGDALSQPVTFEVEATYVPDPQSGFDPYSPLRIKDRAVYQFDTASGELWLKWPVVNSQDLLRRMPDRLSSAAFSEQIERLTKNDWAWVDCYIYGTFRPFSEKGPADMVWESEMVWGRYLKLLAFAVG